MKATMGTFLCLGETIAPRIVSMNETRMHYFYDKLRMANTRASNPDEARAQVYRDIFHTGVEYAIPAWIPDAMERVAETYDGGAETLDVRLMAAMLLERIGHSEPKPPEPKGGQQAKIAPVKPKPRKPSGGARLKQPLAVSA